MKSICIIISIFALISCTESENSAASIEDIEAVKAAARIEAAKVLETQPESMERERTILLIRSHETDIRNAGFNECADSFAAEAKRVMLPALDSEKALLE